MFTARALVITSTILFVLATIYIAASFQQLIEAFIEAPKTGIPSASLLYWLSYTTMLQRMKGYTYVFIVSILASWGGSEPYVTLMPYHGWYSSVW